MIFNLVDSSTMPEMGLFPPNVAETPRQAEALLATRVYLYTLFHKAFGGKPNNQLIDAIRDKSTIDALGVYAAKSDAFANLRLYCKTLSYSTVQGGFLLRANAEYVRLFDHAQPERNAANRSQYSPAGSVCGAKASHVRCLLEQQGLRHATVNHRQDDHVSFLCAIAAVQAQRALDAYRTGDFSALGQLMEQQAAFGGDHLVSWLPLFAERVRTRGTAFLYPQLAKCLAAFAEIDQAFCAKASQTLEGDAPFEGVFALNCDEIELGLERMRLIHLNGIEEHEVCAL